MENKAAVIFAKTLSLVFHPLGMPLVIYLLIRWIDPYYIAPAQADFFVFLLPLFNESVRQGVRSDHGCLQ